MGKRWDNKSVDTKKRVKESEDKIHMKKPNAHIDVREEIDELEELGLSSDKIRALKIGK